MVLTHDKTMEIKMYILFFPPPPCHLMYNNVVNMYKVWMRACVSTERPRESLGFTNWSRGASATRTIAFFLSSSSRAKQTTCVTKKNKNPSATLGVLGKGSPPSRPIVRGTCDNQVGACAHIHEQKVSLSLCTSHP